MISIANKYWVMTMAIDEYKQPKKNMNNDDDWSDHDLDDYSDCMHVMTEI